MNPRKDYLFNTIAGLINASEAVVMMLFVTRFSNITAAGYLTIAFAVGNLLMSIGKFGIYNYLVSDSNNEYSYMDYFIARIITVVVMLAVSFLYVLYAQHFLSYTTEKTIIVLSIVLIYAAEAVEDLYVSLCQKNGWLYKGSLMFISRWACILVVFGVTDCIIHDVCYSLVLALIISVLVFIINLFLYRDYYHAAIYGMEVRNVNTSSASIDVHKVCSLLVTAFPLFFSSFLSFYISNASKYSLEHYASAEIQACFGFVSMPVFAIGLLNSFIYHPQIVHLTTDYREGRVCLFLKKIKKQYFIIVIITGICLLGAYFWGIPFLSWLYHTDLSDYRSEMLILLLAGGFLGLGGYQSVILTIIRKQQYILYGYIPVAFIALISTRHIVFRFGTIGAAISYLFLMIILSLLYEIVIRVHISDKRYACTA